MVVGFNQCLSPLMLWVRITLKWGELDTILGEIVCQWLAAGWWFSSGTPVSSINKTDCHNITEILLKVALNKTFDILQIYIMVVALVLKVKGPSWPWSHGSRIYNYLCNQCLSPLMLWVRILIRARCTTLCDKVCQWLVTGL